MIALDHYARLDSPLHRWPAREKLLGLGGLILAFSTVNRLSLLPFMLATTALLFSLSRLPLSFLLSRLKLPGTFLLAVALVLPFFPAQGAGIDTQSAIASSPPPIDILLQLGPFTLYRSGVIALTIIVARFVCILTLGLLLFGTAPFMTTVQALRRLGLPPILADMILLTYRYLYEISDSFRTLRIAMRLRGFRARRLNRMTLQILSSLAGSLLVRSYEQSERVYNAMRLRGYGKQRAQASAARLRSQPVPHPLHRLALGATMLLSLCFITAEYCL